VAQEQTYQITESELERLETIFKNQRERIAQLETQLTRASTSLEKQNETIASLEKSFERYESAVQEVMKHERRQKWLLGGIGLTTGIAAGYLGAILLTAGR